MIRQNSHKAFTHALFFCLEVCYNTRMPLKTVKRFFETYERVLLPLMLLFGVTTDYIAFKTIDTSLAFLWLGLHLLIVPIVILFIHWHDVMRTRVKINLHPKKQSRRITLLLDYLRVVSPLLLQLSFGALLNASFVFYWFSASFSVSWPFFAIVVLLMVSNDVFRHWFLKPVVQISVYFFACFSIFAMVIPYRMNSIEPRWFVLAGVLSLIIIVVYTHILSRAFDHVKRLRWHILTSVAVIFAVMNGLYFFNIIPPIPLSLREADAYHSVIRSGSGYRVQDEVRSFFDAWNPEQTIHILKNDRVYVYASIFAPTDLNTQIFHRWQFYDAVQKKWIDESKYGYYMTGGRQAGYRGYSLKANMMPGHWRVSVETARGQVLARVRFYVDVVEVEPTLVEEGK